MLTAPEKGTARQESREWPQCPGMQAPVRPSAVTAWCYPHTQHLLCGPSSDPSTQSPLGPALSPCPQLCCKLVQRPLCPTWGLASHTLGDAVCLSVPSAHLFEEHGLSTHQEQEARRGGASNCGNRTRSSGAPVRQDDTRK